MDTHNVAEKPAAPVQHYVVAVRGGQRFAVRVPEVFEIGLLPHVPRKRGKHPAVLGAVLMRGQMIVVFDVAAAIGGRAPHGTAPRMFVTLRTSPPTCLAADDLSSARGIERVAPGGEFITGELRVETGAIPVIDAQQVQTAAHGSSPSSDLARRLENVPG